MFDIFKTWRLDSGTYETEAAHVIRGWTRRCAERASLVCIRPPLQGFRFTLRSSAHVLLLLYCLGRRQGAAIVFSHDSNTLTTVGPCLGAAAVPTLNQMVAWLFCRLLAKLTFDPDIDPYLNLNPAIMAILRLDPATGRPSMLRRARPRCRGHS